MNKKTGYIKEINHNDNLGVIRELSTSTEYIFFLDELSKEDHKRMSINSSVNFTRDESFEQFVVDDLEFISMQLRKVV
jgi:hypothetical protein